MLGFLWLALRYFWEIFTWVFHAEEKIALQFDIWLIPVWQQIPILLTFNALLIVAEVSVIIIIFKIPKLKKIRPGKKINSLVMFVTQGRPIGLVELAMLAFVPTCQKVGSFLFATKYKQFGFRGYIALCVGGGLRLVTVILLPKQVVWAIIVSAIVMRIATWLFDNGQRFKNGKESKK